MNIFFSLNDHQTNKTKNIMCILYMNIFASVCVFACVRSVFVCVYVYEYLHTHITFDNIIIFWV